MYDNKTVGVLIAAAGEGRRMGAAVPKQFLEISGLPVVAMTAMAFERCRVIDRIWVITGREQMGTCSEIFRKHPCSKLTEIVAGGNERQDSVREGLRKADTDIILVHDGARAFVTREIIESVTAEADRTGAAICGVPVKDTIRDGSRTLDRRNLISVQTPQGFRREVLLEAYDRAYRDGFYGTDDAGLVERAGLAPAVCPGSYENIKITTREDMPMDIRTGTGYDVHRLTEGRRLILGGVDIPFSKGLLGHSDADVLVHAVMDAMLGAAGLRDIGCHFPDSDPAYSGARSTELLKKVAELIGKEGFSVSNIDVTLIAQRPKIAGRIQEMEENVAEAAGISSDRINIKATTTEGLGFTGKEEGIAAQAVCLLIR